MEKHDVIQLIHQKEWELEDLYADKRRFEREYEEKRGELDAKTRQMHQLFEERYQMASQFLANSEEDTTETYARLHHQMNHWYDVIQSSHQEMQYRLNRDFEEKEEEYRTQRRRLERELEEAHYQRNRLESEGENE